MSVTKSPRCLVCGGFLSPPIPDPPLHTDCWRWAYLVSIGQVVASDYVARQIQEKAG